MQTHSSLVIAVKATREFEELTNSSHASLQILVCEVVDDVSDAENAADDLADARRF